MQTTLLHICITAPHRLEVTVEHLFSPCTRLLDLLVEHQDDDLEYQVHQFPGFIDDSVKELIMDVSTEECLSGEMVFTLRGLVRHIRRQRDGCVVYTTCSCCS